MRLLATFLLCFCLGCFSLVQAQTGRWMKYEQTFNSSKTYENPLYNVQKFSVRFTAPSGRTKNINGFWDGGTTWRVRFAPDETGTWTLESTCSDTTNAGLHRQRSTFEVVANTSQYPIYQHGSIERPKGSYHLSHADGTPFFWTACTAWNGTLKSTEQEWDAYLAHRAENGYSVIQFVTTQWRGGDRNSRGEVAFEGSGRIKINPSFFQHLDGKVDKINSYGLVAAPVLLWALPASQGRELSPGYYLPEEEAILLARYMVARYGGHQVIWILGGDGKYTDQYEQRWKSIGKGVFGNEHGNARPPGVVAQHPGGGSWIGELYASEPWLDIVGYQSGHNRSERAVSFMTKGPVAQLWDQLPARPLINMEPVYEETSRTIQAIDIRNASYWSILNAPTAGITYGAYGLWPWLRTGEVILNHATKGEGMSRWDQSMRLPGSMQVGYLAKFMRQLPWWNLKPAPDLLVAQPGDKQYNHFVSVSRTDDGNTLVAYLPASAPIQLYNLTNAAYSAQWFNPATNKTSTGTVQTRQSILTATPPAGGEDWVLVLRKK